MTVHNPDVEAAVIGALLADPTAVAEVVGEAGLEDAHFHTAAGRTLFKAIVDGFYDDQAIDALTIGEIHAVRLGRLWEIEPREAVRRVEQLARRHAGANVKAHALLVRRDHDFRRLQDLLDDVRGQIDREEGSPDQIAGLLAQQAMKVATAGVNTLELVSFADAGRQFVADTKAEMQARAAKLEMGAYFGIPAIDNFTRGLRPEELWILAGPPGSGKSWVGWQCGLNFAQRQMARPADQQVGTLVLSLEMGRKLSNMRIASMLTGVNSNAVREGTMSDEQLQEVVDAWRHRVNMPLWFAHAPSLRYSQLRAVVSEAVRKHNVGFVILDHWRYFHPDKRLSHRLDEDGDKAEFLSEQLCKDMNLAVCCIAHTRKVEQGGDGRPKLADLRGSQDIAAYAHYVSFIFRPWLYASPEDRDSGAVDETGAEMLWEKNRHGDGGSGTFQFNPKHGLIR